jgi:hypothetical protein
LCVHQDLNSTKIAGRLVDDRHAKRTLPGELSGAVGQFTIEANMVVRPANSARANETWREEDQNRSSKSEIDVPAVFIHNVIDPMFAA